MVTPVGSHITDAAGLTAYKLEYNLYYNIVVVLVFWELCTRIKAENSDKPLPRKQYLLKNSFLSISDKSKKGN